METRFSTLAKQAFAFGKHDANFRGIWNMVGEALDARDLFRTGWLLSCIPTGDARLMYGWITESRNELIDALTA